MSVFNRNPKSKRYSSNTTSMLDNSIGDIRKMYSDFSRKMSFANARTRSQTFDLAEIQDDAVRENGKLTKNHALLFACIRGDFDAVQSLLLSEGIDVDYCNHNSTALHKAAIYGHTSIIELLLNYGADIEIKNAEGMTALTIAVSQSHLDAVGMLLHYSANVQVLDNQGQSLLHHAARFANIAILMVLINKPCSLDLYAQNNRGFTPLHAAAGNDNIDCALELIKLGGAKLVNMLSFTDGEHPSTHGTAAFHLAAEFGFYDCFLACTNVEGVDVWLKSAAGSTALHLACKHGHVNIVEHILSTLPDKFDAMDPMFFDGKLNTPLHCAALSRNPRCVTLLATKLLSSKSGRIHDWDCPNANKDYPAHLSSAHDNSEALKELLAHKVNVAVRNIQQETPLYIAVVGGFRNCVGLLLGAGATFTDMNANKSLKFEEIGNDIRIDAGTLDELVDHVITGKSDEEFRKSFFIIYKCFTNAVELLDEIHKKMTANWSSIDFVSRVVKVLEFWINNHSRDFRSDYTLLANVTMILKQVKERDGMELIGKQMQALLTKKTHGPVTKRAREISKMLSTSQSFYAEDTGHILAVTKSIKIAQQLCLIEYDIFYSIKKEELFHAAWNHKEKEHISPNVIVFIGRFDQVSKWIRGILLKAEKLSYRTKLLQKCIKVALKCYELRNYTTVMQIMAALESAPISRLNHTWAKISENMKEKYKAICQQLLPAANYKNYRALIAKAEPPCVPYIGTYLTDLTFIDEGNADYLVEGDTKLINYKKFQMISELIQRIQRFQRIGYTFTLDNELKKYLLTSSVTMDDNTAYKLSLKLDPKVL